MQILGEWSRALQNPNRVVTLIAVYKTKPSTKSRELCRACNEAKPMITKSMSESGGVLRVQKTLDTKTRTH